MSLRTDAQRIIDAAITAALPDTAVKKALTGADFGKGKLILVAIGKAAWSMSKAASEFLGDRISEGVVITKYGHSQGDLPKIRIFEAGHPVPDANSFSATAEAIKLVKDLTAEDTVLFLISGGGSALFEKPLVADEVLKDLTEQLLACGANITEINTIRKRLSAVKGGKFAKLCEPAKVFSIVLSDIIGDPLDMIASGPAYPDSSTSAEALAIVQK
ncbi:MAG: glycerate-2-kinase family protein, partial [Limnochordia bacterium]